VDELTAFSGAFDAALDAAGCAPGELTVEVSSAGAERCASLVNVLPESPESNV
jgi:ribosome maturation factor RimP